MVEYEIIKDDPAPEIRDKHRWPFSRMEVGNSVVVTDPKAWLSACRASYACGRRKGWKFAVKWNKKFVNEATHEVEPQGKIWRVA